MKHIQLHNLQQHSILCSAPLNDDDIRLILECIKLIDAPDEQMHVTLSENRKASLCLMPDTSFPIVRMT